MPISGENDKFILIRCADNDEWLHQRTKGIGGSDVASIMGLSPWRTPAQTWLEKTGRAQPEDISDKPYIKFGNIMEPLIGKWYQEQYPERKVRRVNAICQSIERPWAQASLDFEVKDGLVWGVLEIKTARTAADWQDGVPDYYLTQIMHYMAILCRPFADVAVFFRDTCEFRCYRVEYDREDGLVINNAVDDFWHNYVLADVMPQLVGTSGEASALADYYGYATSDIKQTFDPTIVGLIADYQDAADREKKAREQKTEAATKLMGAIGDAKGIETDVARVTWVRSTQTRFDQRRFKKEHPDLFEQYVTTYTKNNGLRVKDL